MDRKKQIMIAATESFSQFGYKATTMELVSKIAKVGKGTIYNYFSNKEELLKAIIQNIAIEMREVANQAIRSENSFIDNFNNVLHHVVVFKDQHELTIKLSQEAIQLGTPIVTEALDALEEEICLFIEERIATAIERREIRPCEPRITAFLMFKMYINLVNDWKLRGNESLLKDEVADLIQLYFIEGLAPTS
ncbi:TetR/AcrR family transcriptional regulator [Gracilibacillus caseinilyticus]|uniref:TetR/AcrR family transcriptional regulator n=1 Tax=Gracilibacillus caseinilyticus TaxID=2932256 RepID=A0ABY4EW01_9BACI|nr:TetR/AcrR family transcriptional regulator [Gracilibacillus caseinilyticus]UOQ48580.1 TetR/AcrR family transcriptional regulator [Gracilibacillus caseinilyticus]